MSTTPGEVFSDDDFYLASSGLVVLETTNHIYSFDVLKVTHTHTHTHTDSQTWLLCLVLVLLALPDGLGGSHQCLAVTACACSSKPAARRLHCVAFASALADRALTAQVLLLLLPPCVPCSR